VRALVVSGIWPPDVGGPASHAPDFAAFLDEHDWDVQVVTTASAEPAPQAYPVHWVSRSLPKGVLHARAAAEIARRARESDVVYTTGMFGRSASGARAARRPYVVKLTADPAFERSRRRGETSGTVDDFQAGGGGARASLYRRARDWELKGAKHVVCPSAWLRDLATTWGVDPGRITVLPNPVPSSGTLRPREELQQELAMNGATLVFAGRLSVQKSLEVAFEALAAVEGVTLLVAGDGDERRALEERATALGLGARIRFLGPQPRERVVELLRAADAMVLSSSWENFPHTVVESLGVGTPVLATATGGVGEVVHDGVNGLLVQPGDVDALADAIRRYFADRDLRERLRSAAAPSVADYSRERIFGRLEELLASAARA
jgi:glycosyltransferase involved in cell wall biosynthesis